MILDGKKTAKKIKDNLKQQIEKDSSMGKRPGLAFLIIGDDDASKMYVRIKGKTCEKLGIYSETYELEEKTSQEKIVNLIKELNEKESIHGILVQLPLPRHLDSYEILKTIKTEKDVDGFTEKD